MMPNLAWKIAAYSSVLGCYGLLLVAGRRGDAPVDEGLKLEVSLRSDEWKWAEEKDLGTVVLHFLVLWQVWQ